MEIKEITSITISIISVVIALLSYTRNVIREHKQLSKEEGHFYQILVISKHVLIEWKRKCQMLMKDIKIYYKD